MLFRKFLFCIFYIFVAVFLIVSCSSQKSTVIEKEKVLIIERIESRVSEINYDKKSLRKDNNYPQSIRLWVRIEDGEIVDNAILSDIQGSLDFQHVEINRNYTKLFVRSDYYNQTWVFDVPCSYKNGEYILIGYLK